MGDKQKATIQALMDSNVELQYENATLQEENDRLIDDLTSADEHINTLDGAVQSLTAQLFEALPFAAVGHAVTDALNNLFTEDEEPE